MNRQAAIDVLVRQVKLLLDSVGEKGIESTATRMAELGQAVRDYEAATPDTCQAKYPGEPTFTLVGRDQLSPGAIEQWIIDAKKANLIADRVPAAKIEDATDKLKVFLRWQTSNQDKVKYPN